MYDRKALLQDSATIQKARECYYYAQASHHAAKLSWYEVDGIPMVDPETWVRWAQSKSLSLPKPLEDFLRARDEALLAAPPNDHNTNLLRKLTGAARHFWELYDPDDPTTAPTNKQVSNWLQEQGVAKRVAEVMAQILRADGLPRGPRR